MLCSDPKLHHVAFLSRIPKIRIATAQQSCSGSWRLSRKRAFVLTFEAFLPSSSPSKPSPVEDDFLTWWLGRVADDDIPPSVAFTVSCSTNDEILVPDEDQLEEVLQCIDGLGLGDTFDQLLQQNGMVYVHHAETATVWLATLAAVRGEEDERAAELERQAEEFARAEDDKRERDERKRSEAALEERRQLEAEAVRRAKRAEARAMEAARREAAARDEAERQAAMERKIQRRVEECVTQKVQEAQNEVLAVPNVFVLLGRLEQALQRTQEQEQKRLELLAVMTMTLQNLQEEQQELRKVQAMTLDLIGQQIGRSMPAASTRRDSLRGYGAACATLAPRTADLAHDAQTARAGALPRALRQLQRRQPQRAKGGRLESLLARAGGCCRRSGKRTWPNPFLRSRRRGQSARSEAPRQPGGRHWAVTRTGRATEVAMVARQWPRRRVAFFDASPPCRRPALGNVFFWHGRGGVSHRGVAF